MPDASALAAHTALSGPVMVQNKLHSWRPPILPLLLATSTTVLMVPWASAGKHGPGAPSCEALGLRAGLDQLGWAGVALGLVRTDLCAMEASSNPKFQG